jgi:hypothetical protein
MRVSITLTVLYLLAVPVPAAAQAWREAYERGDFPKAVALLEAAVFDATGIFPEATATEALATLYFFGLGASQDRVLACSLFDLASRAARAQSYFGGPDVNLERRRDEACQLLGDDERDEASRLVGCPRFGPEPQAYMLEPGHSVEVSRKGIGIHFGGEAYFHQLPDTRCGQRFGLVRYTRVDVIGDSRHFIELFSFFSHSADPRRQRPHLWQLLEIVDSSVRRRARELLLTDRRALEAPVVPTVRLRPRPDGTVSWRFKDAHFAGVVPRREARAAR